MDFVLFVGTAEVSVLKWSPFCGCLSSLVDFLFEDVVVFLEVCKRLVGFLLGKDSPKRNLLHILSSLNRVLVFVLGISFEVVKVLLNLQVVTE